MTTILQPATSPLGGGAFSSNSSGAPAYAIGARNKFNAGSGTYNIKASNGRAFNTALSKANQGVGPCHDLYVGASESSGYNGATLLAPLAWPEFYRQALVLNGTTTGGTGLVPFVDPTGMSDTRIVKTSGVWASGTTGNIGLFTNTVGGVLTITVDVDMAAGTVVVAFDNRALFGGAAAFTVKVGAAAAVPVAPNGTATVGLYAVAGAVPAGTTIVITAGGPTVLYLWGTIGTNGYQKHNLARSGSGVITNSPGAYLGSLTNGAWNPSVAGIGYAAIGPQTYSALTSAGFLANRITMSLCGNDIGQGKSPAQVIAGIPGVLAAIPQAATGCTIRLVLPWQLLGQTDAQWNALALAFYQFADANDYQLVDWYYTLGSYANMLANGILGVDNGHVVQGPWMDFGRKLAEVDYLAA